MEVYKAALKAFKANNHDDLTVYSDVPEKCKTDRCYVGIDEAGRGPVLGPMVYGIFCCLADESDIKEKIGKGKTMEKIEEDPPTLLNQVAKLNDSKQLTEKIREEIFEQIADLDYIAYGLKFISPSQISSKCYRRQKNSLNEVSHDAAIELIQGLIDRGLKIEKVYVDTVGPMEKYQKKLEDIFPELTFKVDKKADAKYKPVSAASVCAKVARDHALLEWQFPKDMNINLGPKGNWGSGYPGDEVTKAFLRNNIDPVFGFPNIVRNSWSTADKLLEKAAVKVKWESEEDDTDASLPKISKFFSKVEPQRNGSTNGSKNAVAPVLVKAKGQFFSYRELNQTIKL